MAQRVVIAVDVLGGDIGPSVVLPGIEKALHADPDRSGCAMESNKPLVAALHHSSA